MNPSTMSSDMVKLLPVITPQDKHNMQLYYLAYEKNTAKYNERGTRDLENHPVFGPLMKSIPKEVSEENSRISMALQRDAIFNDNWEPYVEYSMSQGMVYAKMGLDFRVWYEVVSLVRHYIVPDLLTEYGTGKKFLDALNGMNTFFDIAMGIIGEAYIQQKNEIIQVEKDKITTLHSDLEMNAKNLADYRYALDESAIVAITDQRGIINHVNDNFCSISKYSREELLGQDHRIINSGYHSKEFIRDLWKTITSGKKWHGELRNRAKDGTIYWVDTTIIPFLDKNGKPFQYLAIRADITERKKVEADIQTLNETLEEKVILRTEQLASVNKELEAFTYSVSHDLRAPLRAINGYAEMLNEDMGKEIGTEGQRVTGLIKHYATKMGILIDELLTFSQLGRADLVKSKVDMNELFDSVLYEIGRNMSHKATIKRSNLHSVMGDKSLLYQAVYNLLANAIKYSSQRQSPLVEISSHEDGHETIFSIKDNGVGFDMRYADKLFNVFQRLHSEEEFEGTGVGLAIVYRILSRHNGRIWADAKLGAGATFYFALTNK